MGYADMRILSNTATEQQLREVDSWHQPSYSSAATSWQLLYLADFKVPSSSTDASLLLHLFAYLKYMSIIP
jgi:hypothetical protein